MKKAVGHFHHSLLRNSVTDYHARVPAQLPAMSDLCDEAQDGTAPPGDAVALLVADGRPFVLGFPSPFEAYALIDGQRVTGDDGPDSRALWDFVCRHLPELWHALDENHLLLGTVHQGVLHVSDLVRIDADGQGEPLWRFCDHATLVRRLPCAEALLPEFVDAGHALKKADLDRQLRATFAAGSLIEVRVEDGGHVVSRRRWRVQRV